jgi:hypothetical protein
VSIFAKFQANRICGTQDIDFLRYISTVMVVVVVVVVCRWPIRGEVGGASQSN